MPVPHSGSGARARASWSCRLVYRLEPLTTSARGAGRRLQPYSCIVSLRKLTPLTGEPMAPSGTHSLCVCTQVHHLNSIELYSIDEPGPGQTKGGLLARMRRATLISWGSIHYAQRCGPWVTNASLLKTLVLAYHGNLCVSPGALRVNVTVSNTAQCQQHHHSARSAQTSTGYGIGQQRTYSLTPTKPYSAAW